jgi:hypothetical protein
MGSPGAAPLHGGTAGQRHRRAEAAPLRSRGRRDLDVDPAVLAVVLAGGRYRDTTTTSEHAIDRAGINMACRMLSLNVNTNGGAAPETALSISALVAGQQRRVS